MKQKIISEIINELKSNLKDPSSLKIECFNNCAYTNNIDSIIVMEKHYYEICKKTEKCNKEIEETNRISKKYGLKQLSKIDDSVTQKYLNNVKERFKTYKNKDKYNNVTYFLIGIKYNAKNSYGGYGGFETAYYIIELCEEKVKNKDNTHNYTLFIHDSCASGYYFNLSKLEFDVLRKIHLNKLIEEKYKF